MPKIIRILKLLLTVIVGIAGFLYTDSYSTQHSLVGAERTLLLSVGILPALLVYWALSCDMRKVLATLRHPVPVTVWVWRLAGFAIASVGFFLFIGNRSGQFVSFPLAGTMVFVAGIVLITVKGKG